MRIVCTDWLQPGCVNTTEVDFRKLSRAGRPKFSNSLSLHHTPSSSGEDVSIALVFDLIIVGWLLCGRIYDCPIYSVHAGRLSGIKGDEASVSGIGAGNGGTIEAGAIDPIGPCSPPICLPQSSATGTSLNHSPSPSPIVSYGSMHGRHRRFTHVQDSLRQEVSPVDNQLTVISNH